MLPFNPLKGEARTQERPFRGWGVRKKAKGKNKKAKVTCDQKKVPVLQPPCPSEPQCVGLCAGGEESPGQMVRSQEIPARPAGGPHTHPPIVGLGSE